MVYMRKSRFGGNSLIILFVLLSLYLLWPTLRQALPAGAETVKELPAKIERLLNGIDIRQVKGGTISIGGIPLSEYGIIAETNKIRELENLPPLEHNEKLTASARLKVKDMFQGQYFEHDSPSGVTVSNLGDRVAYSYITMGENLAMGDFVSDADVVAAWMKSPGHRENMLSQKYKQIGVYAEEGMFEGENVWLVVQHFGTERSSCPGVDYGVREEIETIKKDLKTKEGKILTLKDALEQPDAPLDPDYNQKVYDYNNLVKEYQSLTIYLKLKIDEYNDQVKSFNTCLSRYQ